MAAVKDMPRLVMMQYNQSAVSVSNTDTSLPISTKIARKRKVEHFMFKARYLNVTLYTHMETMEKTTSKVLTGVYQGKTNKQLVYAIDRFILVEGDEEMGDEDMGDEYSASVFSLSRFQKDMMVSTVEQFGYDSSVENKSLDSRCKLFC